MVSSRRIIAFVNVAHVVDHSFMLLFPTAVLGMGRQFDRPYGALIAYRWAVSLLSVLGALPAGWLGGPLEPAKYDGGVFHRNWPRDNRYRICDNPVYAGLWPHRYRAFRFNLPSGWNSDAGLTR